MSNIETDVHAVLSKKITACFPGFKVKGNMVKEFSVQTV